ncbi:MAG: hypothetical protein LBF26_00905 [Puniceicoccales bacterium]|jgi:hypothetical protein|nr:hypothetical protein [Puniceicoccales bacterium]
MGAIIFGRSRTFIDFHMQNFAAQSWDIAQLLLGNYLERIGENGAVAPVGGESTRTDESGHIAHALAVYHSMSERPSARVIDLVAGCIASQFHFNGQDAGGCAHAALALLTMGLNLSRNDAWSRFQEETQKIIVSWLKKPLQVPPHQEAFRIVHAIVGHSLGFHADDNSDRLIEQWLNRARTGSTGGFVDSSLCGIGGRYDGTALEQYALVREALQRNASIHTRTRRLPSIRTYMQRYLRLIPDLVRDDGANWAFGSLQGCTGTIYTISFIVRAFDDGWIDDDKRDLYAGVLRKLVQHLFMHYLDQGSASLCIRDGERDAKAEEMTAVINFDAIRQFLFWSQLAKGSKISLDAVATGALSTSAKYIPFDHGAKTEHGLFIYRDALLGLSLQLPLIGGNGDETSNCGTFPHCPGIFDAPVNKRLSVLVPELTFGDRVTVPSFYGKNVSTSLGPRKEFQFRYEQPELITVDEVLTSNIASCKVLWSFVEGKVTAEFTYIPKRSIRLDSFRFTFAIASPHSRLTFPPMPFLGENGLRPQILRDDFQGEWQQLVDVAEDPVYRTHDGKIAYLYVYARLLSLQLHPGTPYCFSISFEPEVVRG